MVRCGSCLQENRDGATVCRRCASQIRETRVRPQRLSAAAPVGAGVGEGAGVGVGVGVGAGATSEVPGRVPRGRRAPGAAVNVRGRLVSVLPNGQDDRVYWLEDDQIDIGRKQGEIRLEDPQLAPRHARLNLTLGGAMLTPLDRRNGVYVRLRSIVELADGDHILIGRQVLRFEVLPEHERRPRPATEDGVVLFGTPAPTAWGRLRQLTSSGLGRDLYHLSRSEITLGREQADLVFADDEFLSRRHAQLTILRGKPVLQDLGSSNGTYLRLRAPQVVVPGDMIRLGDQLLRFELG